MRKEIYYTYLGTNGTLTTPIQLEGIYSIKQYKLTAEDKKVLTKDKKNFQKVVMIPFAELDQWIEVYE